MSEVSQSGFLLILQAQRYIVGENLIKDYVVDFPCVLILLIEPKLVELRRKLYQSHLAMGLRLLISYLPFKVSVC